jgi:hypothetical protein
MAVVAQLVEHRIVIPVVVGSIPIHRPNYLFSFAFFLLMPDFMSDLWHGFAGLSVLSPVVRS